MPRAVILVGFAWPFGVAAVGGLVSATAGISDFVVGALLTLSFAGTPGVMGGVHRLWPGHWPEVVRALLTLGLSAPLVLVEVLAAAPLFVAVHVLCGGYIPA